MYLTDRDSLLRSMYRLLDTDPGDSAMNEHDQDGDLEGISLHLQQGAEDAQAYLVGAGSSWWHATSDVLSFVTQDDGRKRVALPPGFRMTVALPDRSALHNRAGQRWGVEIEPVMKWDSPSSEGYYVENQYLWLVPRASPPTGIVVDYVRRVGAIVSGTTVDFPEEDRTLIVAFASLHAREEAWYIGGQVGDTKLERNLQVKKRQAFRRARRTSGPRRLSTPIVTDHWALIG